MSTEKLNRNYNMSDADLCMFTSNLVMFLTRDLTDLAVFGLTTAKITALKALGDQMEVFPTDGSVIGDLMQATEEKNAIREQVLQTIRNMALRVEIKWGNPSPNYRKLNLKNPSQQSDNDLAGTARTVHTRMTQFLLDLADLGLTQIELDDFEALIESFEESINHQIDEIAKRDLLAEQRMTLGNSVYDLVSTYCNIGKTYYEKVSPAKYNDYIIYTPTPGGLTAPTNLQIDRGGKIISWDSVENATSYELEMSEDNVNFTSVYEDQGNLYFFTEIPTISYWRCRARNAGGYGPFCDSVMFEYLPSLPAPTNFTAARSGAFTNAIELSWSAVQTAESYNLERSVVNIGSPAGTYSSIGSTASLNLFDTGIVNKRIYYRINAQNEGQVSSNSDTYIDYEA